MDNLADLYRRKLSLTHAVFTCIAHEDAVVAAVFKIAQSEKPEWILKVCSRRGDFLRDAYFLKHFAGQIPVPKIVRLIEPEEGLDGAILMECLPGTLLNAQDMTSSLAREIGFFLACIHLQQMEKYGDLTDPVHLSADPRVPFTQKFEEGLEECKEHLPHALIEICRRHFAKDSALVLSADGPCIIHRDFRPGNLLVFEGKISGIIDWSSGRAGFAEEDFGSLDLDTWPTGCKAAFLEGYASLRKVPDYTRLLPLLRLSKAVATVGFTVKRDSWHSSSATLYQFHRQYLENLSKRI